MYKFSEYLADQEQAILSQLPGLDMVQQAQLDMKLHNNAIANRTFGVDGSQKLASNKVWKQKFIEIIQGTETNPEIIRQTIDNIEDSLESHRNQDIGIPAWNDTWITVYEQWLRKLHQLLGRS